jgi:hypothetical protein
MPWAITNCFALLIIYLEHVGTISEIKFSFVSEDVLFVDAI